MRPKCVGSADLCVFPHDFPPFFVFLNIFFLNKPVNWTFLDHLLPMVCSGSPPAFFTVVEPDSVRRAKR